MPKLVVNSAQALWHQIIHDAEVKCATPLRTELEGYLVSLLMRYLKRPDLIKQIIATEYLESLKLSSKKRLFVLQEIGDQCLLFSGLFPKIATKRLVKLSYFIQMGQGAYSSLSQAQYDVFELLAKQFINLMDVLQTVGSFSKETPDLLPLEAYELWNETHSQYALKLLKHYTDSIPINSPIIPNK